MCLSTVKGWLFTLAMSFHALAYGQVRLNLSNKEASLQAKALYRYLQDMAGKKILAGQMASEWGFDEIGYIQQVTGKLPAIKGMDFIDSDKNEAQVRAAEEWWKSGGIPTIMWHWGAPGIGGGYENSKKEIDIDNCFEKGTPEYKAFWKELDEKAALLEKLKEAKVPILWRPFHELNGNWFWWGKKGAARFRRLWITMYDYYVHQKKLDNLIWVLCYTAGPDSAWYPGRDYVDIAGADDYQQNGPHVDMYRKVRSIVGEVMPVPFHECGVPPDPVQCMAQGAKWSWFMEWHTNFLQKVDPVYLKYIYSNDLVVTLDKVPDIMAVYGKSPTLARAERTLCRQLQIIDSFSEVLHGPNHNIDAYDSIVRYDSLFGETLQQLTDGNFASLHYPFTRLQKQGVTIAASSDGCLRIFSWDGQTGGTAHNANNVYQYRVNGKVYSTLTMVDGGPSDSYSALYLLKKGDKTYYLAVSDAIIATLQLHASLEILQLDGVQLRRGVPLIRTAAGMTGILGFNYSLASESDADFHFNTATRTITFPVVLDDGQVTKRKINYTFNGEYFVLSNN